MKFAELTEEVMVKWSKQGRKADLIGVDPPRKGLKGQFIDVVLEMQPEKMCYISFNPLTLARNLALLVEGGYTIEKVQPVDMFPQASHVETVVKIQCQNPLFYWSLSTFMTSSVSVKIAKIITKKT